MNIGIRSYHARTRSRLAGALAAVAGIALLTTACGGGTSAPTAAATSSATGRAASYQQQVAFAHCMRSHGALDFPDPGQSLSPGQGRGIKSNPRFAPAAAACRHLLPNGGVSSQPAVSAQTIAERLHFSRCMRARGVANFPDPNSIGDYDLHGIDPHAPAVKSAALTCVHLLSPVDQQRVRGAVGS